MSWQLIDKPVTQKATKRLAKEFAEMDPAPHDRPLSERRLQVYEKLWLGNQFRPVTWAKAICEETNGIYRVNGKHTSVMISGAEDLSARPDLYVTVEAYQCDTLEDVAKLYSTFDSGLQSRTARDIYLSFAATVPELKVLPARTVSLAVGSMAVVLGEAYLGTGHQGFTSKGQPAERAEHLLEHPDFVVWLQGIISAGPDNKRGRDGRTQARHLTRIPVGAAMFQTWQKAKTIASEFWVAVRDETGASPDVADRKLARYLLTVGVDSGAGSKRMRPVSGREMYVKCLHAWNAWRKGETTNLNYYPDKPVPAAK